MTKRFLTAIACLCLLTAPAHAATKSATLPAGKVISTSGKGCYTPAEAEAEQGIRIHSELMVISLNCQRRYTAGGQNLYQTYRQFTADHGKLFAGYETELIGFFKRSGAKDPEYSLNNLRTILANKISLDSASTRPDMFCYRYAPRIEKVRAMDDKALRQWAATSYTAGQLTKPLCK